MKVHEFTETNHHSTDRHADVTNKHEWQYYNISNNKTFKFYIITILLLQYLTNKKGFVKDFHQHL